MVCLWIALSSPLCVSGSRQKSGGGLSAWSASSLAGPCRFGMKRRRFGCLLKPRNSGDNVDWLISGGGISLHVRPIARSSPSTWGWSGALSSSFGNASLGALVNGGLSAAACLAQERGREAACVLALRSRQGEKCANHVGPSPVSRPAAKGSMRWPSAKVALGALAAAARVVAVCAGARLLALAVAGDPGGGAGGRAGVSLAAAGSGNAGASPFGGGRAGA